MHVHMSKHNQTTNNKLDQKGSSNKNASSQHIDKRNNEKHTGEVITNNSGPIMITT